MLIVRDLSFSFQRVKLFRNLSFELHSGEILHLKGRNGCGKSTLLTLLAGLRQYSSGTIDLSFGGQRIPDRRAGVAYLGAEHNALYTCMTAQQNLEFWSSLTAEKAQVHYEVVRQSLEFWGLSIPWLTNFPVARFSTGMKRRLALARIQLSQRPCFLLDEPFNGLDQVGENLFMSVLRAHQARGGIAVIVSHEDRGLTKIVSQELKLS